MKVVVDIFGGDNAPEEIIKGCVQSLEDNHQLTVVMCGKQDVISGLLQTYKVDTNRIEILDAQDVITNADVPTVASRTKKQSSLVVAIDKTSTDEECVGLVSAGSTGAV